MSTPVYIANVAELAAALAGGSTVDREIIVSEYRALNAGTGYSVDDKVVSASVYDVTTTPSLVTTIWLNATTGATISAPTMSDLAYINKLGSTKIWHGSGDVSTMNPLPVQPPAVGYHTVRDSIVAGSLDSIFKTVEGSLNITQSLGFSNQTQYLYSGTGATQSVQCQPGSWYAICVQMPSISASAVSLASATTTVGSRVITMANTSGAQLGMQVSGTGIVPGSVITAISTNVSITISYPCTASGTITVSALAGYFSGTVQYSTDNANWSSINVLPKTSFYLNGATSTINTPMLALVYIPSATTNAYLRISIDTLANCTLNIFFDAFSIGQRVMMPLVYSSTLANFPTTMCIVPPIETSMLSGFVLDVQALSGTSQVLTGRQSIDPDFATQQNTTQFTASGAGRVLATTVTGVGVYVYTGMRGRWVSVQFTASALTGLDIGGIYAIVTSAADIGEANTANIAQVNGNTFLTAAPHGQTSRAGVMGLAGPTTNTDYSAQAWAAASGSGAIISPGNGDGVSNAYHVNVTAWSAGSSTGLTVFLQESYDGGTTWYDIWQTEAIASVTSVRIPCLPIGGRRRMRWVNIGGAATTATVTVTAIAISGVWIKRVQWFDRTASVTSGTAGLGNGAAYDIDGVKSLTFAMVTGTASAPASFKIQMSQDGTNWYDASSPVSCPASSVTPITLTAGIFGRFARFVCTTAGTSALVTAGHIYGTN